VRQDRGGQRRSWTRVGRRAERERRAAAHGPGPGGALVVPRGGRRAGATAGAGLRGRRVRRAFRWSPAWESRPRRFSPRRSAPPVQSAVGPSRCAARTSAGRSRCPVRAPSRSRTGPLLVGVATLTLLARPPDRIQSGQVRRCGAGDRAFLLLREGACGGTKRTARACTVRCCPTPAPRLWGAVVEGVAGTTRTTSVRQSERMWSCRRRWLVRWRRGHAGGRFRTGQVATGAGAQR
jgi:hypothetical protein